jgi:hypothetical protein
MTGRHKFPELEASLAPERRARSDRMAEKLGEQIDRARSGAEPQLSQAVLQLLERHPGGLTTRQIREKLGLTGNKSCAQSIEEALSALTKSNKVSAKDRKYVSA